MVVARCPGTALLCVRARRSLPSAAEGVTKMDFAKISAEWAGSLALLAVAAGRTLHGIQRQKADPQPRLGVMAGGETRQFTGGLGLLSAARLRDALAM